MTSDLLSPRGVSGMYGSDFEAASDFVWFAPAPDANKYSRGKLVVVAGSSRYPGAAVLAARASQRMGAGYTEVVTAEEAVEIVRLSSPSLVVRPFSSWDVAIDSPEAREGRPCAICMGPGFVPGARRSDELALRVLKNARCPVLVDGGALTSIGTAKGVKRLQKRAKSGFPTVITPHGGEAARLASALGVDATAPDLAHALNAIVVLKGPDTYISDGDRTALMCEGTAALAKAGTGDVLAGMIAALLAQGIDPFDAAVTGATVHARAGIAAAERFTSVSVVAEDLIDAIPAALVL
jgi:hydroxyethylthiazole kinase-like uncharacterized protein yjeF